MEVDRETSQPLSARNRKRKFIQNRIIGVFFLDCFGIFVVTKIVIDIVCIIDVSTQIKGSDSILQETERECFPQ